MENLKKLSNEFDTNEMFNALFRLITMPSCIESISPEEYSKLFLYLIIIKENLD